MSGKFNVLDPLTYPGQRPKNKEFRVLWLRVTDWDSFLGDSDNVCFFGFGFGDACIWPIMTRRLKGEPVIVCVYVLLFQTLDLSSRGTQDTH